MDQNLGDSYQILVSQVKQKIRSAQYQALQAVNKALIDLYWEIGHMIVEKQEVEGWGKSVVESLSKDIQTEFSGLQGFSSANLWRMRSFYLTYRTSPKLVAVLREISWSKHIRIMERCKDDLEREFYMRMTKKFGWSHDVLVHHIENKSYEKYLTNQTNFDKTVPEKYKGQAKLALKDEYSFDFLEISEEHSEKELERRLKCLVAIELKVGKFKPEYAGKMQFYLSALNNQVRIEGENPAIGIIICKSKKRTIVEYALNEANTPIGVASYTVQPTLPDNFKKYLPTPDEIARKVALLES